VWSFFCGLIVASVVFIGKTVKWNWKTAITLVVFAILSFFITSPENAPLGQNGAYWYIFLCGAIAICAMILPGISGSFILVLLGQYAYILESLVEFRIDVIAIFMVGALIGIVSFSHVLDWLFKNFEMITKAALTGFMLGSLNKIWPWKNTIDTIVYADGEVQLIQENILPQACDSQFCIAIALMITGFALIFVIEFISEKMKTKDAKA
jgi:putative membrane protein